MGLQFFQQLAVRIQIHLAPTTSTHLGKSKTTYFIAEIAITINFEKCRIKQSLT